jgi:hypothetical protein
MVPSTVAGNQCRRTCAAIAELLFEPFPPTSGQLTLGLLVYTTSVNPLSDVLVKS